MVDTLPTHQVDYDLMSKVSVYVGLNNTPVATKDHDPRLIFRVQSV